MDNLTKKQKKQRAKRGWSDADAWDARSHLGSVGAGMVERLRTRGGGHPVRILAHEWNVILLAIETGFRALTMDEFNEDTEVRAKWKQACDLLAEWGFDLWD